MSVLAELKGKLEVEKRETDGEYYVVQAPWRGRWATVVDTLNCDCIWTPDDQREFAEFFAAAPETAAERDRLAAEVDRLTRERDLQAALAEAYRIEAYDEIYARSRDLGTNSFESTKKARTRIDKIRDDVEKATKGAPGAVPPQ